MSLIIKLSNTLTKIACLSRAVLYIATACVGLPLFLSIGTAQASVNGVQTWTSPHRLSGTDAEAYPPNIAMNKQGDAIAVWSQYETDKFKYGVWAARYSKTSGWNKPLRISETDGQTGDPQAAINARGDAIVVWPEFNSVRVPASTVWSNYYVHGRGWGRAVKIQTDSENAYFPKVVMDDEGNAIAIWNQSNLTYDKTNIYANYFNKDGGWQRSSMLQRDGSVLSDGSALVMTGKGGAVAVWTQYDSTQGQAQSGLLASFFIKGKGWQEPEFITHDEAISSSIASNKRGDTVAVWTSMNGQTYQNNVHASRYSEAGWSRSQTIQTNPNVDSTDVQIAMDDHGNALAAWRGHPFTNFSDTPIYMYANTYSKDSGWSADEIVDKAAPYSTPRIAMDAYGVAIAVCEKPAANRDAGSVDHDIYAYHYSAAIGWDGDQAIEHYKGDSTDPKVAISSQGDALAVWLQTNTTDGSSGVWSSWRYASP